MRFWGNDTESLYGLRVGLLGAMQHTITPLHSSGEECRSVIVTLELMLQQSFIVKGSGHTAIFSKNQV